MPKIRPNYYRHSRGTQPPSASQVGEPKGEHMDKKAAKKAGK